MRSVLAVVAALSCGCALDAAGTLADVGSGGGSSTTASTNVGGGSATATGSSTSSGTTTGGGGGAGPACAAGLTCAPPIASGDLVAISDGVPPAGCPVGYTAPSVWGDGVDPGCVQCTCDPNVGGTCTPGAESGFTNANCSGFIGQISLSDMQCFDLPGSPGYADGHLLQPSTPSPGGCIDSPGASVPPATRMACSPESPPGGACAGGGVCVPSAAAGFQVCNLLPEGEGTCAAGWTPVENILPLEGDTRVCSCQCTPTTAATCAGASLLLYDGDTCAGQPVATLPADGACHDCDAYASHSSERVVAGTWTPGGCAAQGGVQGALTWGAARVLCCL